MKSKALKSKPAAKAIAGTPQTKRAHIEFTHPTAQSVNIAGSFNDWHPGATAMVALGGGRWAKELTLPPGSYEYRLVVDGEWLANPTALESVANPFGGTNSVLRVTSDPATPVNGGAVENL